MNVKLGICNWCVPGSGIFAPKFVSEAGLDGMSIEFGRYENRYPTMTRQVMDAYLEAAEAYKIEYPTLVCSGFDYLCFAVHRGDARHEIVRATLRAAIDSASYMKIPMLLIPNFSESALDKTPDAFENAVDMYRYACAYAADRGVRISCENQLHPERSIELFERVGAPNFSLFYDSDNYFYQRGLDQLEVLKTLYPYLGPQLHVKDGKPGVLAGSLLGEGDSGFHAVMDYLRQKQYSGWIILENVYEQQPTNTFDTDVFGLFTRDVAILKQAVGA